jgi:hypothetical protein
MSFAEHLTAQRVGLIYNAVSMFVFVSGGTQHGASILYASCEASARIIQCTGTPGASFPLFIGALNTEVTGVGTVDDVNNNLFGVIQWSGASGDTVPILAAGGKNLEIISRNQARGSVTAPTVPASTVALVNPFWHHAAVTIKGGTGAVSAVAIDGVSQGITLASTVTTTVIVPSGKSITLTYAATGPTWTWILL